MEYAGIIAFHTIVVMSALLVLWLVMGKRLAGQLTPFDTAVAVTAGTIAGAGIVDIRIELGVVLVALFMLGVIHYLIGLLVLKDRGLFRRVNHEPTVLVENGQIIKTNLRGVRLTAEMLLQLLREKGVFDISEVELAVLEPTGKLSVLPKAEYRPLTAAMLGQPVPPNRVLVPVVLDGELQEKTLAKLGFSAAQIENLRREYADRQGDVFVALMDKAGDLHVIREDVAESGSFLH